MASAPKCKVCGRAHWLNAPHIGLRDTRPVRTQTKTIPSVRTHVDADYPGRAELLTLIDSLKAENAKLKSDALATAQRRTNNAARMAAKRAAGARS